MCIVVVLVWVYLLHSVFHRNSYFTDALKRVPEFVQFKEEGLQDLMTEITQEILNEPSYEDNHKSIFLIECIAHEKWSDFVSMLSDSVSALVFEKQTKILPLNQYEEMQRKVNTFLNVNIDNLKEALVQCGSTVEISSALVGRLVFRIVSKLFQGTQQWVMKKMHASQTEDTPDIELRDISEEEEKSFLIEIGGFIRNFFQLGLKHSSDQWRKQSECIKAAFVDGQQPISTRQFMKKTNWYSGEEQCIVLSHHCSSFFKTIEFEIMPATTDTSSSQEVIEYILLHRALLENWYYLSSAYFDEGLSLLFLKELVISYVKFSLQFDEKRLNRLEEKSVRASTVALRTHLQRNYVEKEKI